MTTLERGRMYRAQLNPDEWIVRMLYTDEAGGQTIRYVSPTRLVERKGYLRALCLSRESVRTFSLDRISDVCLIAAHRVQMPVPLIKVPAAFTAPASKGVASVKVIPAVATCAEPVSPALA